MTPPDPNPQMVSVKSDRQRFCRTTAHAARIAPEIARVVRMRPSYRVDSLGMSFMRSKVRLRTSEIQMSARAEITANEALRLKALSAP